MCGQAGNAQFSLPLPIFTSRTAALYNAVMAAVVSTQLDAADERIHDKSDNYS
jgi:hypothetical protein